MKKPRVARFSADLLWCFGSDWREKIIEMEREYSETVLDCLLLRKEVTELMSSNNNYLYVFNKGSDVTTDYGVCTKLVYYCYL